MKRTKAYIKNIIIELTITMLTAVKGIQNIKTYRHTGTLKNKYARPCIAMQTLKTDICLLVGHYVPSIICAYKCVWIKKLIDENVTEHKITTKRYRIASDKTLEFKIWHEKVTLCLNYMSSKRTKAIFVYFCFRAPFCYHWNDQKLLP